MMKFILLSFCWGLFWLNFASGQTEDSLGCKGFDSQLWKADTCGCKLDKGFLLYCMPPLAGKNIPEIKDLLGKPDYIIKNPGLRLVRFYYLYSDDENICTTKTKRPPIYSDKRLDYYAGADSIDMEYIVRRTAQIWFYKGKVIHFYFPHIPDNQKIDFGLNAISQKLWKKDRFGCKHLRGMLPFDPEHNLGNQPLKIVHKQLGKPDLKYINPKTGNTTHIYYLEACGDCHKLRINRKKIVKDSPGEIILLITYKKGVVYRYFSGYLECG